MPIGDQVGRRDDDVVRRIGALESAYNVIVALAGSAKAIAAAVQTGLGNLAASGTTWAGPVASPSTVTAAGDITSSGGTFWSLYALNNPVVSGYFALYVNSDGRFGRTVSARRYKQDIANFSPSAQAVFAIQLREFRLKQAVEEFGDDAPIEHGLIAEELIDLGMDWLVQFGPDGQPESIAYEKVALALIPAIQELWRVQEDHEARLAAAGI